MPRFLAARSRCTRRLAPSGLPRQAEPFDPQSGRFPLLFRAAHSAIRIPHWLAVAIRTVGDLTLTGCVESDAATVEQIIDEISIARLTERGATRGDDRFSEAAMEDRKKEGYF